MKKYIFICDKCKKEESKDTDKLPDKWKRIKITVSFDSYSYKEDMLCEKCLDSLGFKEEKGKKEKINIYNNDIRNKLYDIIAEIAQEQMYP
jgi:hypothetical protein